MCWLIKIKLLIDKLQGVIEMYKAELSSANELISHLKLEWSSTKQETEKGGANNDSGGSCRFKQAVDYKTK